LQAASAAAPMASNIILRIMIVPSQLRHPS